jgi:hypothetical protein
MKYDVLPTVSLADLDAEAFAALMQELSAFEREGDLTVKTAEHQLVATQDSSALAAARRALLSGQVRAVQVRYQHAGVLWVDTILKNANAFTLVRMESDA